MAAAPGDGESDEEGGQSRSEETQLAKMEEQLGDIGRRNQQLSAVRSVAGFGETSWAFTARRIQEFKEERRGPGKQTGLDCRRQKRAVERPSVLPLSRRGCTTSITTEAPTHSKVRHQQAA
ncbi:hypothetical protein QFZ79_000052 [Arthrobacter sp. V4I6]|nr:hypothetical protein [Arthrobacter sp. V1I7]MDQ0851941.1 hypothetical protein [Arthrobacter sp. V4I6]